MNSIDPNNSERMNSSLDELSMGMLCTTPCACTSTQPALITPAMLSIKSWVELGVLIQALVTVQPFSCTWGRKWSSKYCA